MGLLTVGIFGFPFLGAVQDHYNAKTITEQQPAIVQAAEANKQTFGEDEKPIVNNKSFFGVKYQSINAGAVEALIEEDAKKEELNTALSKTGQSSLKVDRERYAGKRRSGRTLFRC